jgi:hypothetical protein
MIQSRYEIAADTQNLRVYIFQLANTSLVLSEFACSTTSEGGRKECQDDGFLSPEIREFDFFVVLVAKRKVGRFVADLKIRVLSRRLLRKQRHRGNREQ